MTAHDRTGPREIEVTLAVNGRRQTLSVEPRALLVDTLRAQLGLIGTKRSCDMQVCGACTVLVDGAPVSACTYLTYEARGRQILTIEGLAQDGALHPLQQAFIEHGAFQCGFCTPGMILAACALLGETPRPSADEITHYLRGNICRCTGYKRILEAVQAAAAALGGGGRG